MRAAAALIVLKSFYPSGMEAEETVAIVQEGPPRTMHRQHPKERAAEIEVAPGEVLIEIAGSARDPANGEKRTCRASMLLETRRRTIVKYRFHSTGLCEIRCRSCVVLEIEDDAPKIRRAEEKSPRKSESALALLERAGLRVEQKEEGVLVSSVDPKSKGARAGLSAGDLIGSIGLREGRLPGAKREVRKIEDLVRFEVRRDSYLELGYRRGISWKKAMLPP